MSLDYEFQGWVGEDDQSVHGNMIWKGYEPKRWEESDIDIKITHCGMCSSDLSLLRSGWGEAPYPIVVGHELVGIAVRVGAMAEGGIKVGDVVGVGPQSDSCLNRDPSFNCVECEEHCENYCRTRTTVTYGSSFLNGDKSYGGYAQYHRCPSHFVFKIPSQLAPEHAAPMLCAGVTVYSPLKKYGAGPGKRIGVIGIGGLGHFAVIFARALGASEVIGISRRESKRQEAFDLGCTDYIATEDEVGWDVKQRRTMDLVICTVASPKMPLAKYIDLLKLDATLVQVGLPEDVIPFRPSTLGKARRSIAGSNVGSPREIREMLQLAAEKGVKPWVEQRPMSEANEALVDFAAGKPRFRYVLVNQ